MITPADLAVGQVWRDDDRDAWVVDWLDLPAGRAAWTVVYADGSSDGVNAGAARTLAGFLARNGAKIEKPAPAPIPHPSALADLYAACKLMVTLYDNAIHDEYDGTSKLASLLAEADPARAALAKSEGRTP